MCVVADDFHCDGGDCKVRGKTLGIIGYGHVGSQLSVLAESMGMTVVFFDIVPKLAMGNARALGSVEEVLRTSDFVSLHVGASVAIRAMR